MSILAKRSGLVRSLAFMLVAGFALAGPAIASKRVVQVEETATKDQAPAGFVSFGHIPVTSEQIVIFAENARVSVSRSASATDITVSSNCPRNWNLSGSVVRQAGFSSPPKGVSMMSDALGARAIVNGHVYPLPAGQLKGMSLGKDGVIIGGKKVDALAGSDIPGQSDGPDAVAVVVPEKYSGSLLLGAGGASEVQVSSWNGGKLEATILGDANLSTGNLKSLTKAVVDLRGKGKAEIGDLSTKVLVANVSGSGSVVVKNGSADVSNATVSGDGSISLKGNYKNLKKAVDGHGTINISK